jgi:hypothetical protein
MNILNKIRELLYKDEVIARNIYKESNSLKKKNIDNKYTLARSRYSFDIDGFPIVISMEFDVFIFFKLKIDSREIVASQWILKRIFKNVDSIWYDLREKEEESNFIYRDIKSRFGKKDSTS